ncbi:MAG: general secretion pathway protein GspK [Planctomycetes bacterium]|nr:general secretion pathway protein GspK [Planctomycetota bacterium]
MKTCILTTRKEHEGSALVLVLWIVVLLTVITAVLARTSRLDSRISGVSADHIRCKWASRAGLETAIAVLNDDDTSSDCLVDLWYDNDTDFNSIPLEGCTFTVQVIDESGKLNINIASFDQLITLPDMTEDIANSIIDWRDKDDKIKPGSAEAGYYINLPHPYTIRNKSFRTVRELLLVKGIDPYLLYGPEKYPQSVGIEYSEENSGWINYLTCYSFENNRNADGSERVNINSASEGKLKSDLDLNDANAKWIVQNRDDGFKSIGDLLPDKNGDTSNGASPPNLKTVLSIADKITVVDNPKLVGRVNINTAPLEVLTALLEDREDIAEDIILYRAGQLDGITSLSDLSDISSLKKSSIKKIIDLVTVRSAIFTIYSHANADQTGARSTLEAVVNRNSSPVNILYMRTGVMN